MDAVGAWTDKPYAADDDLTLSDSIEEVTHQSMTSFYSPHGGEYEE